MRLTSRTVIAQPYIAATGEKNSEAAAETSGGKTVAKTSDASGEKNRLNDGIRLRHRHRRFLGELWINLDTCCVKLLARMQSTRPNAGQSAPAAR